MNKPPLGREVRIPLNVAIAGTIAILGGFGGIASWMFLWHEAQRQALEDRLNLALSDAIYTISQRDDRQDVRRAHLYNLVTDRIDIIDTRVLRMETLVLERAMERIIKDQVEEVLEEEPDAP